MVVALLHSIGFVVCIWNIYGTSSFEKKTITVHLSLSTFALGTIGDLPQDLCREMMVVFCWTEVYVCVRLRIHASRSSLSFATLLLSFSSPPSSSPFYASSCSGRCDALCRSTHGRTRTHRTSRANCPRRLDRRGPRPLANCSVRSTQRSRWLTRRITAVCVAIPQH